MASESQQTTNAPSTSQQSGSAFPGPPSPIPEDRNFDLVFKTIHENPGYGPAGQRRGKGKIKYICLYCPQGDSWDNNKRDNASYHARKRHPDIYLAETTLIENSLEIAPPSRQHYISECLPPSESSLRRLFDKQ
ncbi:hypothetical protein DM02DRAFT_678342 [Periconia macrospinosa]|uniref:Uncharacterized protein n=1 Tax=Periconia macrospinosa TaxID=97972 RepID=A0A2V1D0X9_9PLEO|nr:hypothetical protein DM02DRAFT_678342 [Periconia macrospinosa]